MFGHCKFIGASMTAERFGSVIYALPQNWRTTECD